MWGKNYTPQVETYVNRRKEVLQNTQLKVKGVTKLENVEEHKAWRCPKCKNMNGADNKYCSKCGRAVNVIAAAEKEEFDQIADDKIASQQKELDELKAMVKQLNELIKSIMAKK